MQAKDTLFGALSSNEIKRQAKNERARRRKLQKKKNYRRKQLAAHQHSSVVEYVCILPSDSVCFLI